MDSVKCILSLAKKFPDLEFINIGGGIGVPYKTGDLYLDLNTAFN